MGITRPKANKPMSKRRRTKYNDRNFHVQYFITAPKQQSNNAKERQHQNNVAGGLGRGLGPLGPQGPGLGPGSWRQDGVFFFLFLVFWLVFSFCFFCFFLFCFCFFFCFFSCVFTGNPPPGLDFPNPEKKTKKNKKKTKRKAKKTPSWRQQPGPKPGP